MVFFTTLRPPLELVLRPVIELNSKPFLVRFVSELEGRASLRQMRNVMLGVNPDPLIFASFPRLCSFVPKFDCAVVLFAGKVVEDYLVVVLNLRLRCSCGQTAAVREEHGEPAPAHAPRG